MKKINLLILIFVIYSIKVSSQNNDTIGISKQLDELIISTTKIKSALKNTPEIIQIITADEIKSLNANSISEILHYTGSVSIVTGTGSGLPKRGVVSINGLPANYSLILLDGVRILSDHIATGQNIELIPVENIERIEIIKGAYSAQYGSDAMGGTVNIITKKCSKNSEMNFNISGGSYNSSNTGLMTHIPFSEGQKLSSFISWEQSDGLPLLAPAHRIGSMFFDKFIAMNRFDIIKSEDLSIYLDANYIRERMIFRGADKFSWMFLPNAGLNWKINKKISINPVISYVQWESDQNAEKNTLLNPEITFQYDMNKKNTFLAGGDYKENTFTRTSVEQHTQYSAGAFIHNRMKLYDNLDLSASLRYDKVNGIKSVFSPSLSVLYKPYEKIRLRASGGSGFHAPSVQELYEEGYGHGGSAYRFGNKYLKPEYSQSTSLSAEYLSKKVHLVATGFYSIINDMIVPVYQGPWAQDTAINMWVRQNIHSAKIWGGEILAVYEFMKGYNLSVGYTYTENKNENTNKQLPYSPGTVLNCKFDVKQKITKKINLGFFAAINSAFNRKSWAWQPSQSASEIDPSGLITPLDDYQNLVAGIKFNFNKKYDVYLNVYNILEQDIEYLEDAYTQIKGEPYFKIGFNYKINNKK